MKPISNLKKLNMNSLFNFLEKDRFTIFTAFVYLVILGVIRSFAESLFFDYPSFSLYLLAQHIAFNFPVLILGVLVIKAASGTDLRKVYNMILLGFWIVILPPFIDHYIFGFGGVEYSYLYSYYGEEFTFIDKIPYIYPKYLLFDESVSPGLRFMLASLSVLSAFYVAFKVKLQNIFDLFRKNIYKPIVKKISAVFFSGMGIWIVMWIINSTVPTVISLEKEGVILFDHFTFRIYNKYYGFLLDYNYSIRKVFPSIFGYTDEVGLAQGLVMQQRSLFLIMYFFIFSIISLILTFWLIKRDLLYRIKSKINKVILSITISVSLLGISATHLLDPFTKYEHNGYEIVHNSGYALDPLYVLHFPYIFFIICIAVFLGLFASFVSSYYNNDDKYLDKQLIMGSILGSISLAVLLTHYKILILLAIAFVLLWLAFKYSTKLYTLKGSLLFSVSNLLIFFIGFLSPSIWKIRTYEITDGLPNKNTYQTINLVRTPEITGTIIGLMIVLFISIFLLSYLPRFIEDDILEYPKSYLILPLFFLPMLWLNDIDYLIAFPIIGLVASTLVSKEKKYLPLFMLSLQFGYIFLRLTNIISI